MGWGTGKGGSSGGSSGSNEGGQGKHAGDKDPNPDRSSGTTTGKHGKGKDK
ncbi:hypothetical protein [Kitasatospora aureofaciens]|uniref:hypothetical protein n=1 Tax=Kitasatospora aureofaciens TaxID=1894 RepID=UPI001C44B8FB|nr:hypothetical protein [Kitasatospora aureofaciens]MBV6700643.1 hypothetical protein [Kitasatospora aureofaciens]